MISNKFVYSIMACLITLFLIVLMVLPNLNIEDKNDEFSYETKLFNEKKVTTINIEIDEKDWASMMENPMAEEMKEATVTVNGKRINNIGIRTKGNSSLMSVASSDSNRYSLKLDFDYYDSSQSFYGLKKLNLNNNFSDTTQMKEYVSYEILESMGLSTPEHSYMYVTVNGKDYGLMLGVEAVDETFLAKNYGSNAGFLFKPDGTGSDLKYISSNIDDYSGLNPKTNESNIEQSNILDMIDVINNGGDIEEYIDVDNMLRYFATTTALVSMDSYQGMLKHNYYLYEEDGKFSIIPWDYNMAFGSFSMGMGGKGMKMPEGMDPSKLGNMDMPKGEMKLPEGQKPPIDFEDGDMLGAMTNQDIMSEESINFDIYNPVSGTNLEDRPLLNALLKNKEYLANYEKYLKELSTEYFTEENVSKITKEVSATILTYVEADPSKFGTTEQFLEGVSGEKSLAAFAGERSNSILKQLSGELVIDKKPASEEAVAANGAAPSDKEQKQMSPKEDDPSKAVEGREPPEGVELGRMPEGMDPSKMPDGMKPPEGFDPNQLAKGGTAEPSVSMRMRNMALTLGSLLLLLIAIFGVSKFNRRGFR